MMQTITSLLATDTRNITQDHYSTPSTPTKAMEKLEDLEIQISDGCIGWLQSHSVSFGLSTYQIGKLLSIGHTNEGRFSVFERTFDRCMGMCTTKNGNGFYLSCKNQIWRFENILQDGQIIDGYDKIFAPQSSTVTGDCDIHDLAVCNNNELVFVNTLFNCLATTSEARSFKRYWQPSFIDQLIPQDQCHLNGLTNRDGKPAYVTAVSCSSTPDGWRQHRQDGGVVIDIESNAVIASGLSMPHSPRWYRNNLWICNAGTGEFGTIDLQSGKFQPLTFCPGFMRGLAFYNNYAAVGLSKPRENQSFSGLSLDDSLSKRGQQSICGILIINLHNGEIEHSITFNGLIQEIYDVICIQNCRNPMLIGLKGDEINYTISIES